MEIHNAIFTRTNKEPEPKKFNGESDLIIHLQGIECNMELKCGINDNLKEKYFPMSLTGET